jgi:AbrB family looped-hinge helix DNA binding protein
MYTYKVEDIFEDIEDDPDNVLMNIPPEILEQMGWKEGDTLNIEVTDNNQISITLVKKEKDE